MKKIRYIVNCIMIGLSFILVLLIFFIRNSSSNNVQMYNLFNQKIFISNNVYSNDLLQNQNYAFFYKGDVSYNDVKIDNVIIYKPNPDNENLFNVNIVNDFYISINNNKKIVLKNGEDINYETQFVGIVNKKSKLTCRILTFFSRDVNIAITLIVICLSWLVNYLFFLIFLNYKKKEKIIKIKVSYLENFNQNIVKDKKIYKINEITYLDNIKHKENNEKQIDILSQTLIHKKIKNPIINSKNNMYIQYNQKSEEKNDK